MSFGKKKKSSSNNDEKKIQAALTPKPFNSEFGSYNKGTYTATESADQRSARQGSDATVSNLISEIPTSYSPEDVYNNPYYGTYKSYLTSDIDTRREEQQKELNDRLSARNQLGSSYDAYSNYLMNKDFNKQYGDAESQARLGSTDVFNQQFTNMLNALGTSQNVSTAQYNRYYQPLQYALNSQSVNTNYQVPLANYYASNIASANQARQAANPLIPMLPALLGAF